MNALTTSMKRCATAAVLCGGLLASVFAAEGSAAAGNLQCQWGPYLIAADCSDLFTPLPTDPDSSTGQSSPDPNPMRWDFKPAPATIDIPPPQGQPGLAVN
ncbi:hypothetical protein [Nocardia tengchongensis]|uniref:hypothetical protein n=1 Tax=Nocardia tengchongensis TaxID=2055889 RepID=UPI0036CC67AD